MTWHRGPVLGFDTETTGVDVENDRIVTAALVYWTPGGEHTTRTWLSNVDGVSIPAGATAVHGVTNEQAKADGRRAIEVVGEVAQALAEHMATGAPVVAMNARFDFTILDRELRRHGLSTLDVLLGRPVGPVVDPLIVDKQADKYRKGKRSLDALCAHYDVVLEDAHTADADALAAVQVAVAQAEKYPDLQALEALHQWQIGWAASQAAGLQEFKRRTDPSVVIEGAWPVVPYRAPAPDLAALLADLADRWEQLAKSVPDLGDDLFVDKPSLTESLQLGRAHTYRKAAADVRDVLATGRIPHGLMTSAELGDDESGGYPPSR